MRALVAACLFALVGGAVSAHAGEAASAQRPEPPALSVSVLRDGNTWTLELTLPRAARAWVFARSPLTEQGARPSRPPHWIVETPGVRLERHGYYDALVGTDGNPVPARVRVRFTPPPERVVGDYDPALVFSDGAAALFSRQFDAFPTDDVAGIDRLQAGAELPHSLARVTFRDRAGPVLVGGRRVPVATLANEDDGTYVLFGAASPIVTPALTLVVDPQLPAWLRTSLAAAPPGILARYAAALGPAPGPKPTIMVSWAGPTAQMRSMGGGALAGLIVMRFEGDAVLGENDAARQSNLWFIAHESAHFWLGQAVHYQTALDSWITEGGADLLAFRAVAAVDPTYDPRRPLQEAVNDCVRLSTNRGIARALERNEHRAYYACGAVFALVAEASSRRPFTAFVRALLDGNRNDQEVTRAEWLALLTSVSRDPGLARDIAVLLDSGAADPKPVIASLFTRAGVRFTPGPDGVPRLQ
jgi:hypothetical protein